MALEKTHLPFFGLNKAIRFNVCVTGSISQIAILGGIAVNRFCRCQVLLVCMAHYFRDFP
jgi:hypothetical protein